MHLALVVNWRSREVVTAASNERVARTDDVQRGDFRDRRYFIHAEQQAVRKFRTLSKTARFRMSAVSRGCMALVSLRVDRSGRLGCSEACASCVGIIKRQKFLSKFVCVTDKQQVRVCSIDELDAGQPSSGDRRRDKPGALWTKGA